MIPEFPDRNTKKDEDRIFDKTWVKGLSMFSQIAFTILACIFVGVFSGKFLDSFFGTSPWLLLVFSLLGAGAAFKALFDIYKAV